MRRVALFAAVIAILVAGASVVGQSPARAASSLNVRGHGWGHGRGLGQYGALGYAVDHGWGAGQILNHYYGGTTPGTVDLGTPITVRMLAQDGLPTTVIQERNQLFTSADGPDSARVPHTGIKVERIGVNTFRIYDGTSCGGTWTPRPATVTGPVVLYPATQNDDHTYMLQLCEATGTRWLRGSIRAVEGEGAQRTVNQVDVDNYLRGVVPRESPASWGDLGGGKGMQALISQAVAARSYAVSENRYSYAKTCDTTACQVYKGRAEMVNGTFKTLEDPRSDSAIGQTPGQIRRLSNGAVARTEFSSSTGGYTAGGTFPPVPDDGDDITLNPNHTWTTTIQGSALESRYGKGAFMDATVTERNGLGEDGGRATKVVLKFSGGDVNLTGEAFRSDFGLKSNWFTLTTTGLKFQTWEPLGGPMATGPGAASWGTGRLDVFAQGPNNTFIHKWFDGQWRGFETLPGGVTAAPAVTSRGPGRLDMVVRGTDNQLHYQTFDNGYRGWTPQGGVLTSAPAMDAWNANRLDVFARGTDNQLWHKWFENGKWFGWEPLGGTLVSGPAVAAWGTGRLDVFVQGTDNQLWHKWFDGRWQAWEPLGGSLTAAPGVTSWGPGRLDVFVRGTDNGLWQKTFDGGWGGFEGHAGTLTSPPAAAAWSVKRLDIFVKGTDENLWHGWEL
jgi:SpoIID/LytB domain protein